MLLVWFAAAWIVQHHIKFYCYWSDWRSKDGQFYVIIIHTSCKYSDFSCFNVFFLTGSIHQPPALAFDLFDHLYMIADGKCIYAGTTSMLIPFLAELELICPVTYDPFDYCKNLSIKLWIIAAWNIKNGQLFFSGRDSNR